MAKKLVMSIEGSSENLVLKFPTNQAFRPMTYAEVYLTSCYAIWIAALEDQDPRAINLKNEITSLAFDMINEAETIH